jgi:type II secretory pathway pseudopilin PulG
MSTGYRSFLARIGRQLRGPIAVAKPASGFSLAETLISLGVLGALIPMLFFSYANFTGMLVSQREKLLVVHAGSQFLNRMAIELSQTKSILPTSDATNLYFTYYDPIRDEVIKRGYRLTSNGTGRRQLIQLLYNETTQTWTQTSAYSQSQSSDLSLPSTVEFDYCLDTNCNVTPASALSVRLTGWEFYKTASNGMYYRLTLPELNFYLASGVTGDMMFSETPRELFAFTRANGFGSGSGVDLALMMMSPNGTELMTPDLTAPSSGSVSTILSSRPFPGANSLTVDATTGRIFFGECGGSSDNYYTWSGGTLTTLVTGRNCPGGNSSAYDAGRSRIFYGEQANSGNFYTWSGGTLTTLISGVPRPGVDSVGVNTTTGRVFFGTDQSGVNSSLYTWTAGAASVVITGRSPGKGSLVVDSQRNRAFFGVGNSAGAPPYNGAFYLWENGTLTSIGQNLQDAGTYSTALVKRTGRVFFGDGTGNRAFYTWDPNTNTTTTILSGRWYPGLHSVGVYEPDERVYFGDHQNFYTWSPATGLSTIVSGDNYPGYYSTKVDPNTGRVFFGSQGSTGYLTWHSSTGLSTITSTSSAGVASSAIEPSTGRVVFGCPTSSCSQFSWLSGSLQTLVSSVNNPGAASTLYDPSTQSFYFGSSNTLYRWSSSNSLSTVISGLSSPGFNSLGVDPSTGRLFFGENASSGGLRYYNPSTSPAINIQRANPFGSRLMQTMSMEYYNNTYRAAAMDPTGDLYLLNDTGDTVDHYHYSVTQQRYQRVGRMGWSGLANNPRALAVDQAGDGIAILAQNPGSGNWVIQKYSNRNLNGTASAPTELTLTGLTTPDLLSPTGLAVNGRTGDFLVLDSSLVNGTSVRLLGIDGTSGALEYTILINVGASNLSTTAVAETNFKIAYNDQDNLLYLIAPNVGTVYGISLSQYL